MKRLLLILILAFSFQILAKADDITDFQIEGMSIGDSLLDFLSKEKILSEIKENKEVYKHFKPKNKFGEIYIADANTYNQISFFVKKDDPKYKIHLIRGMLRFDNNIEKCLKKKSEITKDIKNLFNNFKMRDYKVKANIDPSGRSYTLRTVFSFQKIDRIVIQCSHWEESFRIKNNFGGGISVIIQTEEIFKWFSSSN
tara:strand:+ start:36 stop:629 length:594 start_codon:yes stop_codon:yes gene_type:complete